MNKFAPIVRDIIGVGGAATLLYGVSLLSVPVALILGGGAAMGLAILLARQN